jgi:hypothetical protein
MSLKNIINNASLTLFIQTPTWSIYKGCWDPIIKAE